MYAPQRERELDTARRRLCGERHGVAADAALDHVEEASLVPLRGREIEGEPRHRVLEATVHVAVGHGTVAPLVDIDEGLGAFSDGCVAHASERTVRLSP